MTPRQSITTIRNIGFTRISKENCGFDCPSERAANSDVIDEEVTTTKGQDISLFKEGGFIKQAEIVDRETTVGTKTNCYNLITTGGPASSAPT